jgi:hypothetical protein
MAHSCRLLEICAEVCAPAIRIRIGYRVLVFLESVIYCCQCRTIGRSASTLMRKIRATPTIRSHNTIAVLHTTIVLRTLLGRHLRRRAVALQPPQYHQRPSVPHNSQSGFTAKSQTREKIGSMSPAPRSMVTFSYEPQIVGQLPRPHNTQLGFTPRVQTLETIASNLPAVRSLVTCSSKSPIVEPLLFWPCTLSVTSSSSRRMVDHLVFPPSYCPYLLFHCPDRTSPRFLHLNPAWSTQTIRMLVAARRTHRLPPCLLKSLGPPSLTAFFSSSIFLEFSHLLPLRERPR